MPILAPPAPTSAPPDNRGDLRRAHASPPRRKPSAAETGAEPSGTPEARLRLAARFYLHVQGDNVPTASRKLPTGTKSGQLLPRITGSLGCVGSRRGIRATLKICYSTQVTSPTANGGATGPTYASLGPRGMTATSPSGQIDTLPEVDETAEEQVAAAPVPPMFADPPRKPQVSYLLII